MSTHVSLAYAGEVSIIPPVSWDIIACFVLAVRLMNQSNSGIVMHSWGKKIIMLSIIVVSISFSWFYEFSQITCCN